MVAFYVDKVAKEVQEACTGKPVKDIATYIKAFIDEQKIIKADGLFYALDELIGFTPSNGVKIDSIRRAFNAQLQ